MPIIVVTVKGGAGSGNWGHAGRPGLVGGSSSGGAAPAGVSVATGVENNGKLQNLMSVGIEGGWEAASDDERSDAKRTIISTLSERTGVSEEDVSEFLETWASTSNDSLHSLAIQKDVAKELGVELSKWQQKNYNDAMKELRDVTQYYSKDALEAMKTLLPSKQQRALVREMYNITQSALAAQGFKPDDTVRLYRGVGLDTDWNSGDTVNYAGNAIESWSVGKGVASIFAEEAQTERSYIVEMDVPVKHIVATATTGFGCLSQGECIVIGSAAGQQATVTAIR